MNAQKKNESARSAYKVKLGKKCFPNRKHFHAYRKRLRSVCLIASECLHTGNVFAEDVKLNVHNGTNADVTEVCVLACVGDDGDLEGVVSWIAYGE